MISTSFTAFDPLIHGFKFPNRFVLSPDILGIKLGSWSMGLCGGMCAQALHNFKYSKSIPDISTIPQQGTPLYKELFARQVKSLNASVIAKIFEWQTLEDTTGWLRTGIGQQTRDEWSGLKKLLDQKKPTTLILIREKGVTSNISLNHQIIAIGYKADTGTNICEISIYDPNLPNTTQKLLFSTDVSKEALHASDTSGNPLRGFFINPSGESASA